MKFIRTFISVVLMTVAITANAQQLRKEVFSYLNLNYPGLEKVKSVVDSSKWDVAAQRLLDYYRHRNNIFHPDIDLNHITISKEEQKWADEALEHTFFVHYGYQPSYNYGKDIDWTYWPVKDNELRWQLHRHKWFTPMGKAYRLSGDEKYAREWTFQYIDWIKKNPLVNVEKENQKSVSAGEVSDVDENARFAWRPLEVSHRLQDQTLQFLLFISSKSFTPEFLTEFLMNFRRHALYILDNYSEQGNHLLFEAQRMIYAGVFFPELKEAAAWRQSGINILNREIKKQVYTDGGQYELDPHYHLAAINIFIKALRMADINGFRKEFPEDYIQTVKNMIEFYANICFPDYSNPCFSDAKMGDRSSELANYRDWLKLFPDCEWIRWFATEGREGRQPSNLSHASLQSGFFTFRNGWNQNSTVMVVKAGPKGEWHCQPDNGTFELWFNGRNLFPDSGSYVYAGDKEVMKLRNWFRRTASHNTLTLDERTLETTQSKTLLWKGEGNEQMLVTENPHYNGLKHRRSVFFIDETYFVIVDEAVGDAKGIINLNYHLAEGKVNIDRKNKALLSNYSGESNVKLQCFSDQKITVNDREGWCSTSYRHRVKRTAVSFDVSKNSDSPVRYITIIYPTKNSNKSPKMKARFTDGGYSEKRVGVEVTIDGKKRKLEINL